MNGALVFCKLCLVVVLTLGCSKEGAAPPSEATGTSAQIKAPSVVTDAKAKRANACDIVTQAEMTAILGVAVNASPGSNHRPPASTECNYISTTNPEVYAELELDWGGGDPQVLGTATGLAKSAAPPGSVDPLQGLGDRAYQITSDQVFISTQGHLMMIRFSRKSADVIPKARKIFELAKARI
jgi:hypothetical protein